MKENASRKSWMLKKSSQLHVKIDMFSKEILVLKLTPFVIAMIKPAVIAPHAKLQTIISFKEAIVSWFKAIVTANLELTSAMVSVPLSARPATYSIQTMVNAKHVSETLSMRQPLADVFTMKFVLIHNGNSKDKMAHVEQ